MTPTLPQLTNSNFPLPPSLPSQKRQSNFFSTHSHYFLSYFRGAHHTTSTEMSDTTGRRQNQRQGTSRPRTRKSRPSTSQPTPKTTRDDLRRIKKSQPPAPPPPPPVPEPVPTGKWKYSQPRKNGDDSTDVDAWNKAVVALLSQTPKPKQDRPGGRLHTSGTPELPPSVKLPTGLTLPGKEQGGMGNQGIRQHVETSTKTGVFHLSKAKLHEFPPELAKIVNALRSIDLSENRITLIPQNISAFVNLKHLNLNSNQIEVIPDQIGQLSKLETLSLANNRIKSVPGTIAHLQKLRDANLSSNSLSSFPVVFSSLKYLTVLDLARNRIPEVPAGVGGLQVVELILNQNQVRIVSKDLALCPNLKTLRLQENTLELSGLPTEILSNSLICLLSLEGNLFDVKQLSDLEGYEKYMDRYTSTKKKLT